MSVVGWFLLFYLIGAILGAVFVILFRKRIWPDA